MAFSEELAADVREQVARIIASSSFARANRSCELLRFLVEFTLAGREHELKEYTIATEAFNLPESFDPRTDSLVRVQATRLRSRLQAYYESAGVQDDIEIVLAPGNYTPSITRREVRQASPISPPVEQRAVVAVPSKSNLGRHIAGATILALLLVLLGFAGQRLWKTARPKLVDLQGLSLPGEVLLSPAFDFRSEMIYFASSRGGTGFRIWKQTKGGKDARPLTSSEWDSFDVDLSPDGTKLAYWSAQAGGGVYFQSAGGGDERLIAAQGRSPRFSADGNRILFWKEDRISSFGKAFVSEVIDSRTTGAFHAVAADFGDAHNPQWMPDGRVLVCGTRRTNDPQSEHDLWIVSAEPDDRKPVKTGILVFLKQRGIDVHRRALSFTTFRFHGEDLVFAGTNGEHRAIYSLLLTAAGQPKGEPVILRDSTDSDDNPYLAGRHLAFTSTQSHLSIWGLPINGKGDASGPPERLTSETSDEFFPSVSRDGSTLVYVSWTPPTYQLWRKNLTTGVESSLLRSSDIKSLTLSREGNLAFFRTLTGTFPQDQQIYSVNVETGEKRLRCANCGAPTSVSPFGEYVTYEPGTKIPRLAVLETTSGKQREILRHPHFAVQNGHFSPDGKWLVFELDQGPAGTQVFVAPFHGLEEVLADHWIPISTALDSSFQPAWSADGGAVYYLSTRLGSRDLWMQPVDSHTKRPSGQSRSIYRFNDPKVTPLTYHVRPTKYVGMSAAQGRIVLTLCELTSRIWLGDLE